MIQLVKQSFIQTLISMMEIYCTFLLCRSVLDQLAGQMFWLNRLCEAHRISEQNILARRDAQLSHVGSSTASTFYSSSVESGIVFLLELKTFSCPFFFSNYFLFTN